MAFLEVHIRCLSLKMSRENREIHCMIENFFFIIQKKKFSRGLARGTSNLKGSWFFLKLT